MGKQVWHKTKYPGIRYRLHPTRKHGLGFDRYFQARYQKNGKRHEMALGWSSEGMTGERANGILSEFKEAQRLGEDQPINLKEKREMAEAARKQAERERQEQAEQEARESITFKKFFDDTYLPAVEGVRKVESVRKSREHVKNWLGPVVGSLPFHKIKPQHLEQVRANMLTAGRTARTIQYVMATFRTIWNKARNYGLVIEESPTKKIELPRVSNTRQRYLKQYEAEALLEALKKKSEQTYQISLLSLHTGMRFSEITGLRWSHIDLETRKIHIFNAKGDKDRTIPMTAGIVELFSGMPKGNGAQYIFPSRVGRRINKISKSFDLAVKDLGFNDNVTDPKLRFTFHCLRHTHASWMVESGTDLFLVQKQLGHSTPTVTQRYAHINDEQLEKASKAFEALLAQQPTDKKVIKLADRR